jgi:hypothetical protein
MAADDDFEEELLRVAGRSKSAAKKRSRQAAESDDEEPAGGSNKGRASAAKKANITLSDESEGDDAEHSDAEERAKLEGMNELEREMYLFERAEQREREKQRMMVVDQARKADQVRTHPFPGSSQAYPLVPQSQVWLVTCISRALCKSQAVGTVQ